MQDLKSELLFDMTADLQPPQVIGGHAGNRMIFIVKGGTFEGPRLRGELLPGGGDWWLGRDGGIGELDVRATLRTDDGASIYTHYHGVMLITPEVGAKLGRGEGVGPDEFYLRTTPRFETSAEQYAWLNSVVAVGVGSAAPNQVSYRVFRIL